MLGVRFWVELDRNEFGLLRRTPGDVRPLLDLILDKLKCGAENLDIICWARRETTIDQQQTVHDLLCLINVNAHRLRCHFFDAYPQDLIERPLPRPPGVPARV